MNPPSSPPIAGNCIRSKFHLARILCIAFIFTSTLISAGPLEDYLNNPPHIVNPPWGFVDPPSVNIPIYLKEFSEAKTDLVKAQQIGRLIYLAGLMADVEELRPAVAELLEIHIVPNLDYTKVYDRTNAYSWRHSLSGIRYAYQKLGDHQAVRKCLNKLYLESTVQNDKEIALYLLAYHDAGLKNYNEAIETINFLPAESKWANHRPMLIREWKKSQAKADQKAKQADQKAKQNAQKTK